MNKFQTGLLIAILFISVQGCTPKAGDPGPKGEPGSVGQQGPQGPAGPAGATGTANVQFSPWISVAFTYSGGAGYLSTLLAPAITQDVLDKADIRVYFKSGSIVRPLPYVSLVAGGTTVTSAFQVGSIRLSASVLFDGPQFRYVIIPGGTAVGGRKATIDYNDYEAVRQAFNLPD